MHLTTGAELEARERHFPDFVLEEAGRERWCLCERIATALSEQNEPDENANSHFVHSYSRWLFWSDVPTGSPTDPRPS